MSQQQGVNEEYFWNNTYLGQIIPSTNAFFNTARLLLWLESATGRQCCYPPASSTSRLLTTVRLLRSWFSL